jgi:class 3 adenylate cyclase/tetratricopeptide (TPR) repeat protein
MIICPSCQHENADGARFCSRCGTRLHAPAPAPVEGERKQTTVLFADVVRSTAHAERLDAEDWAAVMNGAFSFMNTTVTRYGGTVARLMGDAVLAFFGAPVAHEDDAERAVLAGLELVRAAESYAAGVRARYGIEFELRVGINSGTAVLAYMGDAVRAEYTAMGDTANVAARLQAAAEPGAVLVSGDTLRLVRGLFEMESRGWLEVKGKRAQVETYRVLGVRAVPGPRRGLEGLSSPLVGRDGELAVLRERLSSLASGGGGVVLVVGEAGLGKSRLVAEAREARPEGVAWHEGRAVSYGQALPYHPWQQLGRGLVGVTEADPPAEVRARLREFQRRLGLPEENRPLYEAMLAVDTEASRAALSGLEGDALVQRIADGVVGAIRAVMQEGGRTVPHVLCFDDLHWADPASLDLLTRVAALALTEPLLLVCLLRPDKNAASWAWLEALEQAVAPVFQRLDLEPLDPAVSRRLLGNLLHVEGLPDRVRALILERAEGNPFFLEEVLRSLIDSGHIVREDGTWRATSGIADAPIPDTLAGVLSARIDRLPDITKRVAQTAAVLGRIFPYRALTAVCLAAPEPERVGNVDPHLGTLTYEELVREKALIPEREYIFKHALTQEAAYGLLLRQRRRELHERAGRVLEELYGDRREELAPVLAHHYHEGGNLERTALYSLRAAERAVQLYALVEAGAHYERALAALEAMPEPPADRLVDATLGLGIVRYKQKQYAGLVDRLLRAEAVARAADDLPRLIRVLSWIALIHMVMGFASRGLPYLAESSRLADELGMESLLLLPFFFAADTMIDRDPRQALAQFEEVLVWAKREKMPEIEGHALASSAIGYARLGQFDRARERIEEALAASFSGGHRVKEADVYLLVGFAYYELGELEKGLEMVRRGTSMAFEEGALECACVGYWGVGMGELERKELGQALEHMSRALDLAEQAGWTGWSGFMNRARGGHALARLEAGVREAVPDLEQALANARADHDDYMAGLVALQLARAYFDGNELERAAAHLDEALRYYRDTEMRPYEIRAQELAARLHEAAGRPEQAASARARAAELKAGLDLAPAGGAGKE